MTAMPPGGAGTPDDAGTPDGAAAPDDARTNDPGLDRVALFLDDILAGPADLSAVLAAQLAALSALPVAIRALPRRRLVGMGSSGFAARDAAARWRSAGHDAVAEVASASGASPARADTLAIAISSSGATREVVEAAHRHRAGGSFVLALTARPDSALAAAADAVVPLRAGRAEASGIATLTYRATVAALLLLDGVPPGTVEEAARALDELIAGRDAWLGRAADLLGTGRAVHVLGDALRHGTLEQAALMLREAPRIAAMPFDTGDWLHVGLYTLLPGDPALLLGGSATDGEAVATIRARGGTVVSVGVERPGADVQVPLPRAALDDEAVRRLVEPAVAELLAAELWRRTDARLVDPGRAG